MYGCDSWTIKKAEDWTIDDFEVWCWRKFLRVLWTARRSNQSINPRRNQSWIFIGKTDAEAETPILWLPDVKNQLFGKDPDAGRLKAGGEGDDRGWDGWMASLTGWTWVWLGSRNWWWTGRPGMLQSMGSQRVWHDWMNKVNWDYDPRGHLAMSGDIFGCKSWHGRWHGQGASSGQKSGMLLSS